MEKYFDEELQDTISHPSDLIYPVKVSTLPNYVLLITFSNGEQKTYPMAPLLDEAPFQPLRNKTLFNSARVASGTVVWNEEIDIAPEDLYEEGVPYLGEPEEA